MHAVCAGRLDVASGEIALLASVADLAPFAGLTVVSTELTVTGGGGEPLARALRWGRCGVGNLGD